MKNKYIIFSVILSLLIAIVAGIMMPKELHYKQSTIEVNIETRVDADAQLKLYYLENMEQEYSESRCITVDVANSSEFQQINIVLPTSDISNIRLDCESPGMFWDIAKLEMTDSDGTISYSVMEMDQFVKNDMVAIDASNSEYITMKIGNTDPYIANDVELKALPDTSFNYLYVVVIGVFAFILFILLWNRRNFSEMVRGIFHARSQIVSIAVNDFKSRFTGSYLGVVWGIIQPLMTILLFWFVFQVGFRSGPISDAPFILWLVAGMIPWNFFSDAWFSGNSAFTGYSFIVKKVVFNVDILPLIKVAASFILNVIFNLLVIVVYTLYGRFPGVHLIDMVYFSICLAALAWGLSMITATLNVFIKDIGQFLSVVMQFLMWLTPIMWDYQVLPESLSWVYKINPLFYVVNGYREALINGKWFFTNFYMMIWFWVFTSVIIVVGMRLMKKMRPHFADVL